MPIDDERTPRLPRAFTQPIEGVARRMHKGQFDFERPGSEFRRVEKALERVATSEGAGPQLVHSLLQVEASEPVPRLPRSPRNRAFFRYFEQLDAQYPLMTVHLICGSRMFTEHWRNDYMLIAPLVEKAAQRRGEARAYALRDLIQQIGEVAYQELVRVVYEAECALRGPPNMIHDLSFGQCLNQVVQWTASSLPGFFESGAAKLRNAAAHRHWTWDADHHVIRVRDGRWSAEFTGAKLYAVAKRMFSDHYMMTVPVFFRQGGTLIEAMKDDRARALFDQHATPLEEKRADEFLERRFAATTERLQQVGWRNRSNGEVDDA